MSHAEIQTKPGHARLRFCTLVARKAAPVITRTAKVLLLAGIALSTRWSCSTTSPIFDSNYEFVHHVLSMDSTFPGNHGMWRALPSPAFISRSTGRSLRGRQSPRFCCWWGVAKLARRFAATRTFFQYGETRSGHGSDCFAADVARRVSGRGRGVVPDVAVAHMEWAGGGVPHVCRWWDWSLLLPDLARKPRLSCDVLVGRRSQRCLRRKHVPAELRATM